MRQLSLITPSNAIPASFVCVFWMDVFASWTCQWLNLLHTNIWRGTLLKQTNKLTKTRPMPWLPPSGWKMRKKVKDTGGVSKLPANLAFCNKLFLAALPNLGLMWSCGGGITAAAHREEDAEVSESIRPCLVSVCEPVNTKFVHPSVSALSARTLLSVWG